MASRSGSSAALLVGLVILVVIGLFALGGLVFFPSGGALPLAAGIIVFVGVQWLLFRAVGLRSRADEERDGEDDPDASGEGDWRAWRG